MRVDLWWWWFDNGDMMVGGLFPPENVLVKNVKERGGMALRSSVRVSVRTTV